jgi:hypothetical protein
VKTLLLLLLLLSSSSSSSIPSPHHNLSSETNFVFWSVTFNVIVGLCCLLGQTYHVTPRTLYNYVRHSFCLLLWTKIFLKLKLTILLYLFFLSYYLLRTFLFSCFCLFFTCNVHMACKEIKIKHICTLYSDVCSCYYSQACEVLYDV